MYVLSGIFPCSLEICLSCVLEFLVREKDLRNGRKREICWLLIKQTHTQIGMSAERFIDLPIDRDEELKEDVASIVTDTLHHRFNRWAFYSRAAASVCMFVIF